MKKIISIGMMLLLFSAFPLSASAAGLSHTVEKGDTM